MANMLIEVVLGIVGLALIIHETSWVVALGVFLFVWGNNCNIRRANR